MKKTSVVEQFCYSIVLHRKKVKRNSLFNFKLDKMDKLESILFIINKASAISVKILTKYRKKTNIRRYLKYRYTNKYLDTACSICSLGQLQKEGMTYAQ